MRGATGEDLAVTVDVDRGAPATERVLDVMMLCVGDADGAPVESSAIDSLVVGDRNLVLAELTRLTFGNTVDLSQRCSSCGVEVEWPLSMSDLAGVAAPASDSKRTVTVDGQAIEVRPATVADERRARASPDPVRALVELCVEPVDTASDDEEVRKRIEASLEELDPLASIEFAFACVSCGVPLQSFLDLPSLVFDLIHADDARRSYDHHLLAVGYRWSPTDLLGLRPSDRVRFASALVDWWDR